MSKKYDLSILIPARNEMFLSRTVEDLVENIRGNTEVIVVLDGAWADPGIVQHDNVQVIYNPVSIGQRAATNQAARLSSAKYVMKVDAHCAFDEGFDQKMLDVMQDDWTMVPVMRNLHAFDWVCVGDNNKGGCGERIYQGPTPDKGKCPQCGGNMKRDIVWIAKKSPQSKSYAFDTQPKFQYFREFSKRPEGQGDITPTMSLQGSCFMLTRAKYWELNICDEDFGSWGSQGIEVAVKTWLSGGSVMVNQKTWYAHMFRTQGGDFGFPYELSGKQVEYAKQAAKHLFFENGWDKQVRPLSWLLKKFWPVPGWTQEDLDRISEYDDRVSDPGIPRDTIVAMKAAVPGFAGKTSKTKGILYYTNNKLPVKIGKKVQKNLEKMGLPITSVSQKPMPHFGRNIHLPLKSSAESMFRQILTGLEAMTEDIVYFAEHDVLYHPSHFAFTPSDEDTFYYNVNVWFYRVSDGHCLHYDAKQLSGLVGYRQQLITHFTERLLRIEKEGFSRHMGFEPMTHGRIKWEDVFGCVGFFSEFPNVDIKGDWNQTTQRWDKEKFRNQKYTNGWIESDAIPGWDLRMLQ